MPLIEETEPCPVGSRFVFTRTGGPAGGQVVVDIGTYYLEDLTTAADAGDFSLGIGGFLDPGARDYGFEWKSLARSRPVPLVLGTQSPWSLNIKQLYYRGRSIAEVEEFILNVEKNIGPHPGTIEHYEADLTTLFYTYTNCYFRKFSHSYDGSKNFVEYDLTFDTVDEPVPE